MKTHLLNSVKVLTATALISGGIALSVPAYAISMQSEKVTTKIDVRDLETDHGVAKIYAALSRRAKSACTAPGTKTIKARLEEKECAENLLTDFVQDVGDERLTTYYQKMHS